MDLKAIQNFVDTQVLNEPLVFARKHDAFTSYWCCNSWLSCLGTLFCPMNVCCPGQITKHFSLQLDGDAVVFHSAVNDFCCHVATSQKTVPLEKVQDVEVVESCMQTCFNLKQVNVQTAGQGGLGAEVEAAFLENPEKVREAIQLAAKLYRQGRMAGGGGAMSAPGVQGGMSRNDMQDRLQRLNGLVARGTLLQAEADEVLAAVLAAPTDLTLRLIQAEDLLTKHLIAAKDFAQVKAMLLAQAQAAQKLG